MRQIIWTAMALALLGGAAQAGMPVSEKMKCAVGGKSFTHTGTMSYSTWGARPDGKPYGSWEFPMPLPTCPDNGLVMYRDFTPDEIARLKPLIESEPYRALVAKDSTYYRAAWLERALAPSSDGVPWLLLSASWQVDEQPERKAAYQREFIAAADALPPTPDAIEWLMLRARTVNALRELGRFDEARTALRALPTAGLDVAVPAATDANYKAVRDAESRRGLKRYLDQMEVLIARGDRASEPLDMVPPSVAASTCRDAGASAASLLPTGICASPPIVEALKQISKFE